MKPFINEDFLLNTKTASKLYHTYAANLKIIDYHCHIDSADIALDKKFSDMTQLWLSGDHYKWRLMRQAGIDEEYITGSACAFDKFKAYVGVLSKAIGNPLYHWSYMELKNYFGYDGILNEQTAEAVFVLCNQKLKTPAFSARNIIKNSNVELLCTTDDPIDSLSYHEELSKDETFNVKVYPAFRPDNAVNIENEGFLSYIDKLGGGDIKDFDSLCQALKSRAVYFKEHGCKTADHGFFYVPCDFADADTINRIFNKALRKEKLTGLEVCQYKTVLMIFLALVYNELGFVMQLHFGCMRDINTKMFIELGANTGYDCISNHFPASDLASFLNVLEGTDGLPKTVLYGLNPADNAVISTIAGCFRGVRHGAAWWFNDHKNGILQYMENLAATGYLAGFVGMLTDSRSLVSYPRHEYFRRILCDYLGCMAESGEFPLDMEVLGSIVTDISYNNVKGFFGFE